MTTQLILLVHAGATLAMVGLIWFVQIVHYPLFSRVGSESFTRYEQDHQRLTTYVVAPLMIVELATALLLVWYRPESLGALPVWCGLLLLATIWGTTFVVQVPQHMALARAYDDRLAEKLVHGNWVRTLAWTARGILALWMLGQVL